MEILFSSFVFIFGLISGSFLNCIIWRLPKKESFLFGRSYCPKCNHVLKWQDLIPLLSFASLKGKCRYCRKKISFQYPLVEFMTALLFLVVFLKNYELLFYKSLVFGFFKICFLFIISCFLIVIFVYDLKHYIILDKVIFPAIFLVATWLIMSRIFFLKQTELSLFNFLYSALGASAFFLSIVLLSKGKGMGLGDVKLAFFMGLFLGFPDVLVALFLSFFIGAVIGTILIALGKRKLKSEVPFAPFLVTGTFLALFFAKDIIGFYFNEFLIK